jgi:virginiamycin B lyase
MALQSLRSSCRKHHVIRLVILFCALVRGATAWAADGALPAGEGRELVARACAQCHSLDTVLRSRLTRQQWEARIDQMVAKGAKLSDDEIDIVAVYLAKNFGPN